MSLPPSRTLDMSDGRLNRELATQQRG